MGKTSRIISIPGNKIENGVARKSFKYAENVPSELSTINIPAFREIYWDLEKIGG